MEMYLQVALNNYPKAVGIFYRYENRSPKFTLMSFHRYMFFYLFFHYFNSPTCFMLIVGNMIDRIVQFAPDTSSSPRKASPFAVSLYICEAVPAWILSIRNSANHRSSNG